VAVPPPPREFCTLLFVIRCSVSPSLPPTDLPPGVLAPRSMIIGEGQSCRSFSPPLVLDGVHFFLIYTTIILALYPTDLLSILVLIFSAIPSAVQFLGIVVCLVLHRRRWRSCRFFFVKPSFHSDCPNQRSCSFLCREVRTRLKPCPK